LYDPEDKMMVAAWDSEHAGGLVLSSLPSKCRAAT